MIPDICPGHGEANNQGRTLRQVADSERFAELGCLGFVVVLAALAGWATVKALSQLF